MRLTTQPASVHTVALDDKKEILDYETVYIVKGTW